MQAVEQESGVEGRSHAEVDEVGNSALSESNYRVEADTAADQSFERNSLRSRMPRVAWRVRRTVTWTNA